MKGQVTMQLNRANIMQAIEDWLGNELAKRPFVTAVDQETYNKDQFTVTFTHEPAETAVLTKETV